MGWSQSYSLEKEIELLEKVTGWSALDLLQALLAKSNITIVRREEIVLANDFYGYEFKGERIYLSDGRIFEHKLTKTSRTDDSGHDHFQWFLSTEKPQVVQVFEVEETDYEV